MTKNYKIMENYSVIRLLTVIVSFSFLIQLTSCESSDEKDITEPDLVDLTKEVTNCESNYSFELPLPAEQVDMSQFELSWEDNFDYEDSQLEINWTSQNGPSATLCSRWRENAVVENGVLELQARKESRSGQDWTCGNIWSKETFGFGYYECKYKYAGASGTNNSFWLFPRDKNINGSELICELDVNEGHFPNEVNTNRHHWQDGSSENLQLGYTEGLSPAYAHSFNTAIKTNRIRFSSNYASHFHIQEFRIYEKNEACYPTDLLSSSADNSISGLNNLSRANDVTITASGVFRKDFEIASVADGRVNSSWVSQREGKKWLEFSWPTEHNIGHVQFINGWFGNNQWNALITDYKIEAFVNGQWIEIGAYDASTDFNYANDYHVYGMDWNANNIKFYFDDKLIRTIPNTLCNAELNIFLSLAVLEHGGEVTDAIDGTSMKIDYVKYYKFKE